MPGEYALSLTDYVWNNESVECWDPGRPDCRIDKIAVRTFILNVDEGHRRAAPASPEGTEAVDSE